MDTTREPCPWRIIDDAGGAFLFGLGGGTVWHTVGGLRNAPSGSRFPFTIARVKLRVPITAGGFAVWGLLFAICDCSFTAIRKKEDPWNAILSGAATGGILAARGGFKAMGRNAVAGGMILAAIEGVNVALSRILMPMLQQQQAGPNMVVDKLEPPVDPLRSYYKPSVPIWQPEPDHYVASHGVSKDGFDLDTIHTLDSTNDPSENSSRLAPSSSNDSVVGSLFGGLFGDSKQR